MNSSHDEIIEWLRSPEGQRWSQSKHAPFFTPLVAIIKDGTSSSDWPSANKTPIWRINES